MLLLGKIINEVLMAKDTEIFALQHLGLKKSGKICVDTNTEDRSFKSNSRFDSNGIVIYSREIRKDTQLCWEIYNATQVSIRTCEIHRPVIMSSTSSPPSQICSKGK